ncbi:hypothetical protein ENBRE01_0029 [Enteropsectra breve]|nr:hypothetical protein ENBRE01_0029 [Enteropsectra breve]
MTQAELAIKYDVTQPAIHKILKKVTRPRRRASLPLRGRPLILKDDRMTYMKHLISKDPKIGSRKLKIALQENKKTIVSDRTIRRRLSAIGLKGRVACYKPLLSSSQKDQRYEHAKAWIYWTKEDWERTIFSDETKINLFGSDGRTYVRRYDGERYDDKNLIPTVKHGGGSVMVWGCFSYNGVGKLAIIDGNMNSIQYTRIVDSCLEQSAANLSITNYILQQDNDPKHTSTFTKDYFTSRNINVMSWPSQSPDMNPIEHLWAYLKPKIHSRCPKNKPEAITIIQEEWSKIPLGLCRKLIDSMPDRIYDMCVAKGSHTKY